MGKITVKHYLNKSVKPRIDGNKERYPLYVQIIANRTNYRFKSEFPINDGYLTESDLIQDFAISIIENESKKLELIVSYILETQKFDLMNTESLNKLSKNLWEVLNRNFGMFFEKECEVLEQSMPTILAHRNYDEITEVMDFTESEIEAKFSDNYRNCKIAMKAFYYFLMSNELKELNLFDLTVFDYLHGDGSNKVLMAIKNYISFAGRGSEKDYLNVLDEIEKLLMYS